MALERSRGYQVLLLRYREEGTVSLVWLGREPEQIDPQRVAATSERIRPAVHGGAYPYPIPLTSQPDRRAPDLKLKKEELQNGDLDRGDAGPGQSYGLCRGLGEVDVAAVDVGTPVVDGDHGGVAAVAHS